MEVFGIPVVVTVRDILNLGGIAIVLGLYVAALLFFFVSWAIKKCTEWRKMRF